VILLNGNLVADDAVTVLPSSAGVFTTIRVRGGRVEFLEKHAARLARDAKAVGMPEVTDAGNLAERCAACVAANGIVEGGVKVVWFADDGGRTGEVISNRPHAYGAEVVARGFRLMTMRCAAREARVAWRHKTLDYGVHAEAKRAAVAAGFDDALWIDDGGRVLEGATTTVYAVFSDEIVTPEVSAGLLPGVAREVVLGLGGGARPVRAGVLTQARLAEAEEIFVTNSLMGVMPVRGWDARELDVTRSLVTREVAAAFDRVALGLLP
jgi:branched-chain amino acid aminotransferase